VRVAQHRPNDLFSTIASTEDNDPLAAISARTADPGIDQAPRSSDDEHRQQRDKGTEANDRRRHSGFKQQRVGDQGDAEADRPGGGQREDLGERRGSPAVAIQANEPSGEKCDERTKEPDAEDAKPVESVEAELQT